MDNFILETYKKLHSIAELGFNEINTSKFLADNLENFDYKVTKNVGTTGIVAELDSGVPGKTIGFRADMDALPFEEGGKEVVIHACGHDANSTMLLTTAKRVAEAGIKTGKLYIVFQQAEERIGAIEMANTDIMKEVPSLIGMHLRPMAEAKLGEAISGLHSGAGYFISMEIEGQLAHGARAHQGVNAIEIAMQIVNSVNCIKEDVTVPHSIKVTQIESIGNSKNTIPNRCRLVFDTRSQNNEVADSIIDKVKTISTSICEANGANLKELEINGVPAAEIDEELFNICDKAVINVLGKSKGKAYTVGGEDIHYFNRINGTKIGYIGLGADMEGNLHSKNMTFNIDALETGVSIQTNIVEQTLGLK